MFSILFRVFDCNLQINRQQMKWNKGYHFKRLEDPLRLEEIRNRFWSFCETENLIFFRLLFRNVSDFWWKPASHSTIFQRCKRFSCSRPRFRWWLCDLTRIKLSKRNLKKLHRFIIVLFNILFYKTKQLWSKRHVLIACIFATLTKEITKTIFSFISHFYLIKG